MKILLIFLSLIIAGIGSYYLVSSNKKNPTQETQTDKKSKDTTTAAEPVIEPPKASDYFYPMTKYESRITNRDHGKSTTLADSAGFPCGGQFEGIHVGDDLEVTKDEITQEIPVFAFAAGKVLRSSVVGGYGGLLITEHTINNEQITAYYGHVDLAQNNFSAGETFKAGEVLSYLGDNCSAETSNERKHLHFDIHKGSSIDVRGYVKTLRDLANWIDPTEYLKNLKAAEPEI